MLFGSCGTGLLSLKKVLVDIGMQEAMHGEYEYVQCHQIMSDQ